MVFTALARKLHYKSNKEMKSNNYRLRKTLSTSCQQCRPPHGGARGPSVSRRRKQGCVMLSQELGGGRASERAAQDAPTQSYSWLSRKQPTSFSFLRQESSGCCVAGLAAAFTVDRGDGSATLLPPHKTFYPSAGRRLHSCSSRSVNSFPFTLSYWSLSDKFINFITN